MTLLTTEARGRICRVTHLCACALMSHNNSQLSQQRWSDLTLLLDTQLSPMLTNGITCQGVWLKAKHHAYVVRGFSSLPWIFKKRDDIRHLFESTEKSFEREREKDLLGTGLQTYEHTSAATQTLTKTHKDTHTQIQRRAESPMCATQQPSLWSVGWQKERKLRT